MKRKRLVTMGIMIGLTAVLLAGCGTKEGSVLDSAIRISEEAESVEAEGTINMGMKLTGTGEKAAELKINGKMNAFCFTDPMKLKMNMIMDVSGMEALIDEAEIPDMEMESYAVEQDGEYVQYIKDGVTGNGKWYKQVIGPADDMEKMQEKLNQLDAKMFMNGDYTYTEQPDAEENGKKYKVYTCTVTKENMEKVMDSVGSMLGSASGFNQEDFDAVSEFVTDLKFTLWIDEEEKQLYRVSMSLTEMMNQVVQKAMEQSAGSGNESGQVEITQLDFDIKYKNYNSAEDFTVPEEALKAEAAPIGNITD